MKINERQQEILNILDKKHRVSTQNLAVTLDTSEMTVRRDLALLERAGLLKRYHGGALISDEYTHYPLNMRIHVNEKEKRDLAVNAKKYLSDGQTVFLNSSSTNAFLLPHLKDYRNITVITNSVAFLSILAKYGVRCVLTGGEYKAADRTLTGFDTNRFLSFINPDVAFLAFDGLTDDGIITDNDPGEAEIARIMMRGAKKKILLADHSKIGLKFTYTVCTREDADELILL